jgi:hypothetical protein
MLGLKYTSSCICIKLSNTYNENRPSGVQLLNYFKRNARNRLGWQVSIFTAGHATRCLQMPALQLISLIGGKRQIQLTTLEIGALQSAVRRQ